MALLPEFRGSAGGAVVAAALGLAALSPAPSAAATLSLVNAAPPSAGAARMAATSRKHADQTLGLHLDGKARVTFTFLSGDAGKPGRPNQLIENSHGRNVLFKSNKAVAGAVSDSILSESGLLSFKMKTRATKAAFVNQKHWKPRGMAAVLFGEVFNDGRSVIVSFDNGRGAKRHFNDLVARIDVAPVPLPAAAWLLLGSLGGLGLVRYRRTNQI